MKKAILFGLMICFVSLVYSQNLVVNSGMEEWEKINRPAGWSHVENCLKDSAFTHSGKYSCRHAGGTSTTSDLGQTIPVEAGKDYYLSLHYKTGEPSTGNGSRIWCYWKDAAGTSIIDPATDDIMRPSEYLKSDLWEKFSIEVTAPANAMSFYLELRTNSNSLMFWDNLVFMEIFATSDEKIDMPMPVIYPNPVSNMLKIRNISELHRIDIQDLNGTTLKSVDSHGETEIMVPVAELQDGLYVLKFHYQGKTKTQKFIKIH